MSTWSSAQIREKLNDAEQTISRELNCVVNRIALQIYVGKYTYELPTNCIGINRISYKGVKLEGLTFREVIALYGPIFGEETNLIFEPASFNESAFSSVIGGGFSPTGKPTNFIYDSRGLNKIILLPFPSENIDKVTGNLWLRTNIVNGVIIEYLQLADNDLTVPNCYLNPAKKYYALSKLFAIEGKGQDLNASAIYNELYKLTLTSIKNLLQRQYDSHEKESHIIPTYTPTLNRPRLPWNYGTVVD